jgi:hypothetical protein
MLVQTFTQFRKAVPAKIDASTLKRLKLAPNNESMVVSTLRFLKLIDEQGSTTPEGKSLFTTHADAEFSQKLAAHIESAYKALFDDRGQDAWQADRDSLIAFFRTVDETSALTGARQAIAFETLAALAGHGDLARVRSSGTGATTATKAKSSKKDAKAAGKITDPSPNAIRVSSVTQNSNSVGLTVRIEINLPAQGDQETYDRIFKSIRANLLNQ